MSLFSEAREAARQNATGDTRFLDAVVIFFELRVPAEVSGGGAATSYTYPLVLPPQSITFTEPFALEKTPTLDGGLFIEEGGHVWRECEVSGDFAFRPRLNPGAGTNLPVVPPQGASFTRKQAIPEQALVEALSGRRHLEFLTDTVFRTYADLKRDPTTSLRTSLILHLPYRDEHWLVAPMEFSNTLAADEPLNNKFSFKLLLLGGADPATLSADEELFTVAGDAYRMARHSLAEIQAGIQDATNLVGFEIDSAINNGTAFIQDAQEIADAANNFVGAAAAQINTPIGVLNRVSQVLDTSLDTLADAVALGSKPEIPAALHRTLRGMQDGILELASYPENFATPLDRVVTQFNERLTLRSRSGRDRNARTSPKTVLAFGQTGTALLTGDATRADGDLGLFGDLPTYASAKERVITSSDTLPGLASQFLGNGRLWPVIAIFNDLQAPYLSDDGLPRTLGVGDTILIPSTEQPVRSSGSPAVLGAAYNAPRDEKQYGVDLKLTETSNGQFDLEVNTEAGAVDFKLSRGRANLVQAVEQRIRIEKGTSALYPDLGVYRLVGVGLTKIGLERAQFSLIESLQSDPRVASVTNVAFKQNELQPDVVGAEIDVAIRGAATTERVRVNLR